MCIENKERGPAFMAKFTKEQYSLVEKNYNLVYFAVNKLISAGQYSLQNDYDDLVQVAAMALCNAALKFDSSKGTFSTYATTAILNALRKYAEKSNTSLSTYTCENIDEEIEDAPSFEQRHYEEIHHEQFELDYSKEIMSTMMDIAKEYTGIAQQGVYCLIAMSYGYTVYDLAQKYKTTTNNIAAWMSRAKEKLKKESRLKNYCLQH